MISLILVMVCAIAAGWLARRIHVPYPIVLVLAGIGLGVVYTWPALDLGPDAVLAIVIPAVLYPAAIDTSWRDFRVMLRPILLLAIGLVATTTLAVGLALKWLVPGVPWSVAFALGAIVSPRTRSGDRRAAPLQAPAPDRDAARGREPRERRDRPRALPVRRGRGVDRHVLRPGARRPVRADRARRARGGHRRGPRFDEAPTAPARSDARARDVVDGAVRGVLAVRGARGVGRLGRRRRRALSVALESSALVGDRAAQHPYGLGGDRFRDQQLRVRVDRDSNAADRRVAGRRRRAFAAARRSPWSPALSAVAIGVRFLWIFTATYGVRVLVPSIQRVDPASARVSTLVSWSGMRGVVSLAAAVALPTALASGEPFPERSLVILLAYGIVFVTLVGQGLTLPVLIRWLSIKADSSGDDETRLARERDAPRCDRSRRQAGRGARLPGARGRRRQALLQQPLARARGGRGRADRETRRLARASSAQRDALIGLWKRGEIGDDVLIRLERDLDLAEARLPQDD